MRRIVLFFLFAMIVFGGVSSQSNDAPRCGFIDAIDYPITNLETDTLQRGWDDFARYRERFGGNHVGLDMGFRQPGRLVLAAARGRVTYSDPFGWDTEKGVVIIEHTFPDSEIFYTLYGHVEASDDTPLALEGACIERGDPVGTIGVPSLSLPHLHFEIRDFLPDDGGPGYVIGNPLDEGWYHPLDFLFSARLRLLDGFVDQTVFRRIPAVPPVTLDSGAMVSASPERIEAISQSGDLLWSVTTISPSIALAALPDGLVVAQTEDDQVIVLQDGRFLALWEPEDVNGPFVALRDALVFPGESGSLTAYTPGGQRMWMLNNLERLVDLQQADALTLSLLTRSTAGYHWRIVAPDGRTLHESRFDSRPVVSVNRTGEWVSLSATQLQRFDIEAGQLDRFMLDLPTPGSSAALTGDQAGNLYYAPGDGTSGLLALNPDGSLHWQIDYVLTDDNMRFVPLLTAPDGCTLFVLNIDGTLRAYNAHSGESLGDYTLYAGGFRTTNPEARVLASDENERIQVGAGFLSLVTLDPRHLFPDVSAACAMG